MKFFTPELYVKFNSSVDSEADEANQAWENAIEAYEAHLKSLRGNMPSRIGEIADKSCFHDAEILSVSEENSQSQGLFPWTPLSSLGILTLKQEDQIIVLIYLLWTGIRRSPAVKRWKFSSRKRHWLYDEIDVDSRYPGCYWHNILTSDGSTIEVPFFDVHVRKLDLRNFLPDVAAKKKSGKRSRAS